MCKRMLTKSSSKQDFVNVLAGNNKKAGEIINKMFAINYLANIEYLLDLHQEDIKNNKLVELYEKCDNNINKLIMQLEVNKYDNVHNLLEDTSI